MPDEQYCPTLLVVKDVTTSGASPPPARSAWLIVSSLTLPVETTSMFGWSFSKRAMFSSIASTSPGADQPCQNFSVTGFVGSSVLLPLLGLAQPDSSSAAAPSARARGYESAIAP